MEANKLLNTIVLVIKLMQIILAFIQTNHWLLLFSAATLQGGV